MKVEKVLWPTDFSKSAQEALPYVNSLTQQYEAEIHILYVIEDLAHHEGWYGEFEESHIEKLTRFSEETARKKLDQICEKYLNGCPLFIKHVAMGDPAQEILSCISREKIDMVVMATRGAKGNFPFGSVAEKVVKNSPAPVVTIPVSDT